MTKKDFSLTSASKGMKTAHRVITILFFSLMALFFAAKLLVNLPQMVSDFFYVGLFLGGLAFMLSTMVVIINRSAAEIGADSEGSPEGSAG